VFVDELSPVACFARPPNTPDRGLLLLAPDVVDTARDGLTLVVEPGAPFTGNRLGDMFRCASSSRSASALVCRVDRERVSPLNEDDMVMESIAVLWNAHAVASSGSYVCSDVVNDSSRCACC
jgi:hypothetical protein